LLSFRQSPSRGTHGGRGSPRDRHERVQDRPATSAPSRSRVPLRVLRGIGRQRPPGRTGGPPYLVPHDRGQALAGDATSRRSAAGGSGPPVTRLAGCPRLPGRSVGAPDRAPSMTRARVAPITAALVAVALVPISSGPPPLQGSSGPPAAEAVAVFAGGCFWGVEAVFEHLRGVRAATAGYAGGTVVAPSYEQVSTGETGHVEAVQVAY